MPDKSQSNGMVGGPPPSPHHPYGIDTSTAGTLQERYFMVLAGLLDKNLAVQLEIRDQLARLNKNLESNKTPEAQPNVQPIDKGRKARDAK